MAHRDGGPAGLACGSLPVGKPVYWELSRQVFNLLWWAQYLSHLLSSVSLSPTLLSSVLATQICPGQLSGIEASG